LGDRDPLVFNADGTLDLRVQSDAPDDSRKNNSLPVKNSRKFLLNVRLYWH
jgi:hypothetical protein